MTRGRKAADLATEIVDQVGVVGEIGFVRYLRSEQRFVIPVSTPGLETIIDVDAASNTALVSRRQMGILESVGYLHKNPEPTQRRSAW